MFQAVVGNELSWGLLECHSFRAGGAPLPARGEVKRLQPVAGATRKAAYRMNKFIQATLILLTVSALASCTPYGILPSAERIESEIKDKVPIGSKKEVAIEYFEEKGVSYSVVADENALYSSIHHVRGTMPLAKKSLFIRVYYNEEGVITDHEFSVYYTGL